MSRIKGRDTKPELLVRRGIHALGLRYRLHQRSLPGTPDIVLPRHKAVVFIHGCFWHGHGCKYSTVPSTRRAFWSEKIARNVLRDEAAILALTEQGWRVVLIWECALRGTQRRSLAETCKVTVKFVLDSKVQTMTIAGIES